MSLTHAQSCLTLLRPHGLYPTKLLCSWAFLGRNNWNGLPLPPPGDLPDPGIELVFLKSPALQADSLPLSHLGSPNTDWVTLIGVCHSSGGCEVQDPCTSSVGVSWGLTPWVAGGCLLDVSSRDLSSLWAPGEISSPSYKSSNPIVKPPPS